MTDGHISSNLPLRCSDNVWVNLYTSFAVVQVCSTSWKGIDVYWVCKMVHVKPLCWDNFRSSSGSETIQKCPLSILSRRTRSYTSFLVWGVLVLPLQIQEDLVAGYIQHWAVLGMVHSRRVRAPHYSLRRQQKTERGETFHCHLNQQLFEI